MHLQLNSIGAATLTILQLDDNLPIHRCMKLLEWINQLVTNSTSPNLNMELIWAKTNINQVQATLNLAFMAILVNISVGLSFMPIFSTYKSLFTWSLRRNCAHQCVWFSHETFHLLQGESHFDHDKIQHDQFTRCPNHQENMQPNSLLHDLC